MATDKYRPHGHMGAKSSKLAADQAVLKEHFGRYYPFVQRLGGITVIYFIIGAIIGRQSGWGTAIMFAFVGLIYAFIFHVKAISYFAARSKLGLEICPKISVGYFWSWLFIPRMILDHIVMLGVLIWVAPKYGIIWFLLSGIVLYILDYIITMTSMLRWIDKDKRSEDVPPSGVMTSPSSSSQKTSRRK